MRKLTLKPDCIRHVPHRVLTHSVHSRAGTMHSIHNPGSAGLTSGGTDIAISVEPGLHQDLSSSLVFIQGHLPTSAVALLPLPAVLRLLTHALHPFCGWNAQSVGLNSEAENNEKASFSFSKWEYLTYVCLYAIKGKVKKLVQTFPST